MLAYQEKDGSKEICWIQFLSEPRDVSTEPKKQGPLTVICPCRNNNLDPIINWHCTVCFESVNFGFDGFFYCDCGKTPTKYAEFKCTSMAHGKKFQRHQEIALTKYLGQTVPFSEKNLLILGETGVGKSTWINSFINFLTYESLAEAKDGKLCNLIPSQFMVYDENYNPTNVCTGSSENEMFGKGQSGTQQSRIYKFQIGNEIIRLIDTPGIGDTRGIDQDKENFQNILQTIANIDELHGICVLLKPNTPRLHVVFRFCIAELLTNLHRDASKNIVFCFTNTRGTFYRPGDTMPGLQELLKQKPSIQFLLNKQTVYCFDSEAYRYLAAVMNDPPVTFAEDHEKNFEKSWETSMADTKRMLAYINSLRPHETTRTLSLNHARELVLALTRPLADISTKIEINRTILIQDLQEIIDTEANMEKLEKRRFTTMTDISFVPLEYPRTVCSNSKCVKSRTVVGDVKTIDYVQICHKICRLKDVTKETMGHPRLMKCWAFKKSGGTLCCRCEHPYNEHVHIYNESKLESVEVEDPSIKEAMDKGLNAAQMKQNMIRERQVRIDEYEEELQDLEKASVQFACFLKYNAITPYNDAREEYLTHLIREETNKVAQGGNPQVLERLERSLRSYIKEREILELAMQTGEENAKVLHPEDIEKMVNKLKQSQLSGINLKKALECVDNTRAVMFHEVHNQKCIRAKNKSFKSWAAKKLSTMKDQFGSMRLSYQKET